MLKSNEVDEVVDGSSFTVDDMIRGKRQMEVATAAPALTLSFSANPITKHYNNAVAEVAQLKLRYKEVLEEYSAYAEQLAAIKEGFFSYCQTHGQTVADNLEQEAENAINDGSIKPEKASGAIRLNAVAKSECLLKAIDAMDRNELVHSDGFVPFSTLKKAFISTASKIHGGKVKMQGITYFEVPSFGKGQNIISKTDVDNRKGAGDKPTSAGRNWINVNAVKTRLTNAKTLLEEGGVDRSKIKANGGKSASSASSKK